MSESWAVGLHTLVVGEPSLGAAPVDLTVGTDDALKEYDTEILVGVTGTTALLVAASTGSSLQQSKHMTYSRKDKKKKEKKEKTKNKRYSTSCPFAPIPSQLQKQSQ